MDKITEITKLLDQVCDPEIPVLSIADLGVLQNVEIIDNQVMVSIISTYSACPAMGAISDDIKLVLADHGMKNVEVQIKNSPIWTTDMISNSARQKLLDYGIAPPVKAKQKIHCPQCGSFSCECISQFGSTACKALYKCNDCLEPFDYFKCHV